MKLANPISSRTASAAATLLAPLLACAGPADLKPVEPSPRATVTTQTLCEESEPPPPPAPTPTYDDQLSPTRLLRRIVITLTGHGPTDEQYAAMQAAAADAAREVVLSAVIDEALASPAFYDQMLAFGHESGKTLLDDTLVMVFSEFASTWSHLTNDNNFVFPDDHWPITSVTFVGGGVAGSRMVGGFDLEGFSLGPRGKPVDVVEEDGTPNHRAPRAADVVTTALRILGLEMDEFFIPGGYGEIVGVRAGYWCASYRPRPSVICQVFSRGRRRQRLGQQRTRGSARHVAARTPFCEPLVMALRSSRSLRAAAVIGVLGLAPFAACDCTGDPISAARAIVQAPELLDFGPIAEGSSVARPIVIDNVGQADLEVNAVLGDDADGQLTLDTISLVIPARESGELNVRYAPVGVGEDHGAVVLATNDTKTPELTVQVHGGPIEPSLGAPASVDFAPADASIVSRTVSVTNDGLATLHIDSIAIDVGASPQFATDAPFDIDVLPAGQVTFTVTHSRSVRTDEGRLLIRSTDPADAPGGGVRAVRLLPDPLGPCEDGIDNDGDLLEDFPDDPGCSDFFDDTEENQVDCVEGATQICGSDVGVCESGLRTCTGGTFGACEGDTAGVAAESACDNLDEDCDGSVDDGITEACTINGCAGNRVCLENGGGTFGPCQPTVSASEQCNTLDDDCDGVADNLPPQACSGPGGCPGSSICDPATGTFGACFCNGVCGDNFVDPNEQCDDGGIVDGDGCSSTCLDEICGDGVRQIGRGEQCDDGNRIPGDGCENDCTLSAAACDASGTYTIDSPIAYSCCFGSVSQSITAFVIAPNDTTTTGSPGGFGMTGAAAVCPSGTFSHSLTLAGGCTETYTLEGTFLDANTFSGTYTMDFVGGQCDCFGGADTPCVSQTFDVTATR